MLRVLSFLILLLLTVSVWAGQDEDEVQLRKIKTELWPSAYRNQDTGLLGKLLHETFQMIDGDGNISTRDKELAWVAENAWQPGDFEYRIERLDIYAGQTAIVAGTGVASNYSYKSSNVLIKQDGRWQAIASHVSGYRVNEALTATDEQ